MAYISSMKVMSPGLHFKQPHPDLSKHFFCPFKSVSVGIAGVANNNRHFFESAFNGSLWPTVFCSPHGMCCHIATSFRMVFYCFDQLRFGGTKIDNDLVRDLI